MCLSLYQALLHGEDIGTHFQDITANMIPEEIECHLCGEEFNIMEHRDRHMAAFHSIESEDSHIVERKTRPKRIDHSGLNKPVQCDLCGFIAKGNTNWKKHMNAKHVDPTIATRKDKSEQNQEALANEIVTEFENSIKSGGEKARQKAIQLLFETNSYIKCGNIEPFSANDLKDLIIETGISQLKTIKLMMKFKSKWGINIAEADFRTELIEIYEDTCKMNQQRKAKTGREKNCKICEKEFSCGFTLGRHMRMHTGEKPYLCSLCDSSFTRFSHLKKHQENHSEKNTPLLKK